MADSKGFTGAALREFVVIVLGVLTALGVDAAWEHRQELAQEQEYLVVIADDFDVNRQRLERAVEVFGWFNEGAVSLLERIQAGDLPPADSIRGLVDQMGGQFRFEPQLAALVDLTSTGGLRLLRNQELRRELSGFLGFVDQLQARAMSFNEQWDTGLAVEGIERLELSPYWSGEPGGQGPADWGAIISTREFRNLATRRADLARSLVADHERVLEIVIRIEALVAEDLDQ